MAYRYNQPWRPGPIASCGPLQAVANLLPVDQLGIDRVVREQLRMGTRFNHLAVVQHDDQIGLAYGRETVRDDQSRAVGHQRF